MVNKNNFKINQNLMNDQYFFRSGNFSDSGLIKLGKCLETYPVIKSIAFNFCG